MSQTLSFSINYEGKNITVSRKPSIKGNYYAIDLDDRVVKLKGEGLKNILWLEKGKGATSLASELGKLIEKTINLFKHSTL